MLSKKVLKYIQSLALKKSREESGLFIAEGPKIVEELIQLVPDHIESVYATTAFQTGQAFDKIEEISDIELQKISQLKTPNQVLAVVKQFKGAMPDVSQFVLYLDTIQDPGNFGTIIRIADWFGINHIVCSTGCADQYNPKVVQSTMGSISRVQVHYTHLPSLLDSYPKEPLFAATLDGKDLNQLKIPTHGFLLVGNESKGVSKELLARASTRIRIPGKGRAESLNASVATAIILAAWIR